MLKTKVDDAQAIGPIRCTISAEGTDAQVNAARATYVLAQAEVDRLQKVYEGTRGDPNEGSSESAGIKAIWMLRK